MSNSVYKPSNDGPRFFCQCDYCGKRVIGGEQPPRGDEAFYSVHDDPFTFYCERCAKLRGEVRRS